MKTVLTSRKPLFSFASVIDMVERPRESQEVLRPLRQCVQCKHNKKSRAARILLRLEREAPRIILALICLLFLSAYWICQPPDEIAGPQPDQMRYLHILNDPVEKQVLAPSSLTASEPSLVFLVMSTASEHSRRQDIRASWASKDNSLCVKNRQCLVLFVVPAAPTPSPILQKEFDQHGDVIIPLVEDTPGNTVFKNLIAYRWLNKQYPLAALAKVESDVVVRVDAVEHLTPLRYPGEPWIECFAWRESPVYRDGTKDNYVSYSVYPDSSFPSHCHGHFYMMSAPVLKHILNAAAETMVFNIENIFFTGVLVHDIGLSPYHSNDFPLQIPNFKWCHEDGSPTAIAYSLKEFKQIRIREASSLLNTLPCRGRLRAEYEKLLALNQ